ncbi:type II secretion system F family protein, partial [Candidatus Omnitrophota bacterium]
MPAFKYKIRDSHGRATTGTLESDSKEAVARHFKNMGYVPTFIQEIKSASKTVGPFEKIFKNVKLEELIVFTRQLMTLQRAGVPILSSLDSIQEQISSSYFKKAIVEILHSVEDGKSLSDSFAQYPDIFSEIYVNMVRSGEASGAVDNVLNKLGDFLEYELEIKMRIKQATRYPLLVLISIAIAFPLAIIFIIPKFTDLFKSFDTALPLPTRILLDLNYIFVNYWFLIIFGAVFFIVIFRKIARLERVRPYLDSLKLKIPVFGDLFLKIAMSRFTKMSSILLASGIPIVNALETVKGSVGNKVIANSIDNIITGISEGESMAATMKASGLYPSIILQMVKVGEETGQLDELLI